MNGSIGWLARQDALARTSLNCLTSKETRAGHRQELYPDTYERLLLPALEQLTGMGMALWGTRLEKSSCADKKGTF